MAGVLIVTWDGGGNVPPALGVGTALVAHGHHVRVLGHPRQRAEVQAADLDFVPYSRAIPWTPMEVRSGPRFLAAFLRLFSDPRPGEDVRAELDRERTDLVLADAMSLGALRGAQRAGMPTATLGHTFHRYLTHGWARSPIGIAAALRGLRPGSLWNAADRVLVATDRDLDPVEEPLPGNVRHIGVVQPTPRPPARDGDPLVLVSLSTIHYPAQRELLDTVLEALDGTGVRALVATGGTDPAGLHAPAGVELHRRVAHDEVMPRASLLIGHGGHATTMRALAHDLPVLVLPLDPHLDQPMIGEAVTAAGAGRTLPVTARPEQIREAVLALLADGPHHAAAAAIGARIRATDGAARAVEEIEAVLDPARARPASGLA